MADFEEAKKLNFEGENASPEEWDRLRRENRDLQLERDKLGKKLDKKKNELENEKTNTTVFRQYVEDLKNKIKILERDKETLQVINPARFDPGPALTGEIVKGQNTEIETLKSEISSMKTKLVQANQNLEIARGEINRFEKLVRELKLELSEMENECNRLSISTNDRDTLQQLLNDKTTENETLKTKIQDLSTTNKHYLSQLQRKYFTIETTTNKFDKERQQIQEQAIQNETNLNEQLINARAELEEFYSQSLGSETTDQDILTKNEQLIQQVARLEEDNAKLQEEFTQKPSKQELIAQLDSTQSKITELLHQNNYLQKTKNEIEYTLKGELNAARDEVSLLKTETNKQTETIGKQNETIETYKQLQLFEKENRSFDNKQTQGQFQMELTESKRHREDLERKLGEMTRDLTDRDRKMRELTQPTAIQQNMGQLSKSPSTAILGPNPKLSKEKAKSQSKEKDSKYKYPDPFTGATNVELTPQLIPQPNKTVKSPFKITFRGTKIYVVKLKAFPNMTECLSKQVICTINKHYELGQLMCIAELPTKVGLQKILAKHAGVKLCNPVGNCDGTYKGLRYFDCLPNYGIFIPLEDVYVHVP